MKANKQKAAEAPRRRKVWALSAAVLSQLLLILRGGAWATMDPQSPTMDFLHDSTQWF